MSSEPAGNFGSIAHPLAQASQIFAHNIFCDNAAASADDLGRPYGIIAATRANVRDGHPGFDGKQTHELAWFAGVVALLFIVPDRADDVRDWAIGFRKGRSIRARLRQAILRRA